MRARFEDQRSVGTYLLPSKGGGRIVVFTLIFLAAIGARLYRIANSENTFHLTRQFRSALIARAYYYRSLDSISEWEKRVAESNLETEPRLEAPIMEYAVVLLYHIFGEEDLWVPRALSSIFWVIGGVFLYAIARRLASPDAALLAAAFYLFLPFGVTASRSFQRDPLMVMLILAGVLTIVRYADRPSLGGVIIAAAVSALTIFVKPIAFFPVFGAYFGLAILRRGVVKAIFSLHSIIFGVIAVLPTVAYTVYGTFIGGFLTAQAQRSFLPHVMIYPYFWHGWLAMIGQSVGRSAFVVGLLGLMLFRDSFTRALMIGLWASYFVFGLVFNYGIYTHNYYQLMLIPIVGLSLMPAGEIVLGWLRQPSRPPFLRAATWVTLVLLIFVPLEPLLWDRADPRFVREVTVRKEIGDAVDHTTQALILDTAYGKKLKYYGKVGGRAWPSLTEIRFQELLGRPRITAEERLDEKLRRYRSEFFIVVNMHRYRAQKDLKELLNRRYRRIIETESYVVFDLRERIDLDGPQAQTDQ